MHSLRQQNDMILKIKDVITSTMHTMNTAKNARYCRVILRTVGHGAKVLLAFIVADLKIKEKIGMTQVHKFTKTYIFISNILIVMEF